MRVELLAPACRAWPSVGPASVSMRASRRSRSRRPGEGVSSSSMIASSVRPPVLISDKRRNVIAQSRFRRLVHLDLREPKDVIDGRQQLMSQMGNLFPDRMARSRS